MDQHIYVVVLRGPSGARIPIEGPPLEVRQFPCATGRVDLIYRTFLSEEGFQVSVPRGIWVDARGKASSLNEAVNSFWNASHALIDAIAVSANVHIGPLDVELAYDNTPTTNRREYFQCFIPPERGVPAQGRRTELGVTTALLSVLSIHPDQDRLLRAIAQYHLALSHWKLGHETLCLAHLFMGMEALTVAALRDQCQKKGCTEAALADSWSIAKEDSKARLLSETRRRVLFRGDEDSYKKAKEASDGLEHGYLHFDKVHANAQAVRDKTANYLRSAILELSGLRESEIQKILSPPYDKPLETWKPTRYVRGFLVGTSDQLAANGQEYPILKWSSTINSVSRNQDGEYSFKLDEKLTAILGPGIQFEPSSHEVWGPPKDDKG